MKSQLPEMSALLDGELEPHEVRPLLQAIVREEELRQAWRAYTLIGDQIRRECLDVSDMTTHVMARVRDEPVVLAPRNLQLMRSRHPLWALAASVAGVAVVGWLGLTGNSLSGSTENRLAAVPPAPTFMSTVGNPQSVQPTLVAVNPGWGNARGYRRDCRNNSSTDVFRCSEEARRK
jgi:negative regulator of sigma E activity